MSINEISSKQTQLNNCSVGFYGKYIPLQGVEYIIEAAAMCPEITFTLIGSGQTYQSVRKLHDKLQLNNVMFVEKVPYDELIIRLKKFDILLGIFGVSRKAQCVIPNKVYDAAALGKAIISADSKAIRELFVHRENIFLCKPGNSHDLAEKITELAKNETLRTVIGCGAYKIYKEKCTPTKIGHDLLKNIGQIGHK